MIVLDTHTIIWLTGDQRQLSRRALTACRRDELILPSVCCWEYAMLATRGRIRLSTPLPEALSRILAAPNLALHPLSPRIAIRAARISLSRAMDPADQIIAATAMELDLPLVTRDERLHGISGLRTIW